MNSEIKAFSKGIHNTLAANLIPREASSGANNWLTQSGRIKLAGGRQRVGMEGLVGSMRGLWTGYNVHGDKIMYRKTANKLQYLVGDEWFDILIGLTDTEFSCANYSSLAGNFTLFNGRDGFWLINNGDVEHAINLYLSTKNYLGYIMIDRGRCILWNRDFKDFTGLYGSRIDLQNATTYTQVTSEAIGVLGSKHYVGTLAFKAGNARAFNFSTTFTALTGDGQELFTDNLDGTLTSDKGGTGTIHYATGGYIIDFNGTTTGAVTSSYQHQDFTNKGIADFTKSTSRLASEGFQFPQDEGGDPILTVVIGQDGAYYSLKRQSAYRLKIEETDLNAVNEIYRKDMGIQSWKGAISTAKGIVFINTANELNPILTILIKNQLGDNVEPVIICPHFRFSDYDFTDAAMDTYDMYVIIACKRKGSDENDVILFVNLADKTVDVIEYEAMAFAKDGVKLYCASSISQDVFRILVGFDDEDLSIQNYFETKDEDYGRPELKKYRRLRFGGLIEPDQKVDVYQDSDGSGYSIIGTIDGKADYVDYSTPQAIGYNTFGGAQIGGDDIASAYPFYCELKVKVTKFGKRKLKLVATGIGYVEIQEIMDWDIQLFENRIPKKYRTKRLDEIVDAVFGPGTFVGAEVLTGEIAGERYIVFGPSNVEGSWRMIVNGPDFILQRYESGAWANKTEYTP